MKYYLAPLEGITGYIYRNTYEKYFHNINKYFTPFIVPNQKSDKPLYEFVVATDAVEKQTGIDFFPQLDDKVENALERNSDYKSWSF